MPIRNWNIGESSADSETLWRQGNTEDYLWFDGEEAFVVYHRPSGKTHLINDVSSYLLRDLLSSPKSLTEIALAIGHDSNRPSKDFLESLAATLKRFEQLGLVERA